MAWKNEKGVLRFNVAPAQSDKFYVVARKYCQIDDIARETREDGRIVYRVNIKHKNMNHLSHDVEILRICEIDIKGGA